MVLPSWLSGRRAAAALIIVWAGALHVNMLNVQKHLQQQEQQQTDTERVTIKLSTNTEEE